MFEDAVRTISDAHGSLEREMASSYFNLFVGPNRSCLSSCQAALSDVRSRLSRVQEALGAPLWVVLLGRFSSGKSSLINALLRECKGEGTRRTGLSPTDKQATLILHESVHTGLLAPRNSVIQVDGLSVMVEHHKVDRLRPLLLVDTPGLLDEGDIDNALMEFVGHADVVLHCMTPDCQLMLSDRQLLDKRRQYFPSQIYQIVITKGDLHYRDAGGKFSSIEWDKNINELATRFSLHTRENLDIRQQARTRKVWLVDSLSGRGIPELLDELHILASDLVGDVPRVREPIARERLKYVCILTADRVIAPLRERIRLTGEALANAQQVLASETRRWEANTLAANREVMRLEIQALQLSAIPTDFDQLMAASLGVAGFLEPGSRRGVIPQYLLGLIRRDLVDTMEKWMASVCALRPFNDISGRHEYHTRNYRVSRENMQSDVIPEYCKWFDGAKYGIKLRSLLGLESARVLLDEAVTSVPSKPEEEGAQAEEQGNLSPDAVQEDFRNALTKGIDMIIETADGRANPQCRGQALGQGGRLPCPSSQGAQGACRFSS